MRASSGLRKFHLWTGVLPLFLLFASSASSEEMIPVRILSLLSPRQVQITLQKAGTLITTLETAPPISEPVPAGQRLTFTAVRNLLVPTGANGKFTTARLKCGACRIEIKVPQKMQRVYSGDLQVYADNSIIDIILYIDLEELVASIIESEHGALSEPEALKALAVTVRSFLSSGARHSGAAAFCDTTHCQVFQGIGPGQLTRRAARETSGWNLTYRGSVFRPYYSRSCGGRTATFTQVWGEASPDYPFPAVNCPCPATTHRWTTQISTERLVFLTSISNPRLTLTDGLIEVAGNSRIQRYSIENFRTLLGRAEGWKTLPSNRFEISSEKNGYAFSGAGAGHGVGLCQQGIALLAKQGVDFRGILSHYFPGATVSSD